MRIVRRLFMLASATIAAAVLAFVALLATLHTTTGRALVRDRLAAALAQATGGRVSLGALETPTLGTIVLRDLVISLRGQSVVRAKHVEIDLALPLPVPPTLGVRRVLVDGLAGHLVRRNSTFGASPPSGEPSDVRLRIRELVLRDARLGVVLADETPPRKLALSGLSLQGALALGPRGQHLELTAVHGIPRGVPLEPIVATATVQHSSDGSLSVGAARIESGATRLEGRLDFDPERRLDLRARAAAVAPHVLASFLPGLELPPGTSAELTLRGPLDRLLATSTLDLSAAGRVALRGQIDATAASPAYRLALEMRDLAPGTLHADWPKVRVQATLYARGRELRHTAHGRIATEAGRLVWRGRAFAGAHPTYRASGHGEVADLARLAGGITGRFPVRFDVGGSDPFSSASRAHLRVEIGSGVVQGTSIHDARASVHVSGPRLRIASLRASGGELALAGDGTIDVERQAIEASLELTLAGRGRATTTLGLAKRGRTWAGAIRTLRLAPVDVAAWEADGPAPVALDGGLHLSDLRLRSGTQRAQLSGRFAARGPLAGALVVSDVQLAPLCGLTGRPCDGVVSGRVEASGTLRAPRFALTATARDVAAGPLAHTTIEADVRHEDGRAAGTIRLSALGGTLVVAGGAPLGLPGGPAPPDALDLQVTARRFNLTRLAAWAPRIVQAAAGRIHADLHLGGTWARPRPEGTITMRAPFLELAPSGARWEDVHVVLRADGSSVLAIERLTARGGEGSLTGRGSFAFDAGIVPTADVRLALDHFLAVDRSILEASCNGSLRVKGSLASPTVRGRLYVPEGTLRPAFLPAANSPTEPDPTIEVIGLPEAGSVATPAGLGRLTLGLTITLGNGMHIRRRDADIQLGGTLRVERVPPEPLRVRGTVEIERGWYTFSGRRFRLRGGAVRFGGGPVNEAELDVEATRRTGEYDVTVAIQGTVAKPVLLLSSDPPLDEPDVLAVLLVGRPSGELNDSERLSVQAEAASLAVDYVVPGLGGGLNEALPLDQVQVSPEELRLGHQISTDVFVSLSQQFVGYAGQSVAVEYAITRRLSAELSTSSRGSGAIDLFWRRRY